MLRLVRQRALVVQCGMAALAIVEQLDVVKQRRPGLVPILRAKRGRIYFLRSTTRYMTLASLLLLSFSGYLTRQIDEHGVLGA